MRCTQPDRRTVSPTLDLSSSAQVWLRYACMASSLGPGWAVCRGSGRYTLAAGQSQGAEGRASRLHRAKSFTDASYCAIMPGSGNNRGNPDNNRQVSYLRMTALLSANMGGTHMWTTTLDRFLCHLFQTGDLKIVYPDGVTRRYGDGQGQA